MSTVFVSKEAFHLIKEVSDREEISRGEALDKLLKEREKLLKGLGISKGDTACIHGLTGWNPAKRERVLGCPIREEDPSISNKELHRDYCKCCVRVKEYMKWRDHQHRKELKAEERESKSREITSRDYVPSRYDRGGWSSPLR